MESTTPATDLRQTDSFILPDGRPGRIESGSSYKNHWQFSSFSGSGYLVSIEGEPVAQTALRFDAIRAARILGGTVVDSSAASAWEMPQTEPGSSERLQSGGWVGSERSRS